MAKPVVRIVGTRLRSRSALHCATALQAAFTLVISLPAVAQPAPSARPLGGQVVAGAATITTAPTTTTITQSSARAAVNWTSFNVGSAQSVTFDQPSATAVTLNRVTGPDPSAIAGRITANGQVVLTNPSGVTFYEGSQVNAQSVIVSAAGITNQNFMAGRMAFTEAPNPNARIDNRGTITVKQAGLAALVAPSVANSGVINAKLGRVVLAGATTHALDMYGDGLVSIDVTGQVRQAPIGPGGTTVTALVTNTGVIQANGGVVQLTAKAADGVVQTLVNAGGRVQANTVGGQTGRVEITGTGGSVVVSGRLMADGRSPGATGGQVMVAGDTATTIAGTAHVTASGSAGGGTIAIGTTLARAAASGAAPPGTSARTTVAAGARISADAKRNGGGGRVTVLSTQQTQIDGTLTARGGPQGGNGGTIEMSGGSGFSLTGTADTSAPKGALGTILLDPTNLTIIANGGTDTITPVNAADPSPNIAYNAPPATAMVREATIEGLTGNIYLQATNNLVVNAPLSLGTRSLTLEAGNNLTVAATSTITTTGLITLTAAAADIPGFLTTGALSILGTVSNTSNSAAPGIALKAGTGGISIGGVVSAPNTTLQIATGGAFTETGTGQILANEMEGTAGSVSLPTTTNQIANIGTRNNMSAFTTTSATGDFSLVDSTALTVGYFSPGGGISVQSGRTLSLVTDTLNVVLNSFGGTNITAPGGTIVLAPLTTGRTVELTSAEAPTANELSLTTTELASLQASTLQLGQSASGSTAGAVMINGGGTVDLGATMGASNLVIYASGAVTQTAPLAVPQLSGQAASLDLSNETNVIPALGAFTTTTGSLALTTMGALAVNGPVLAGGGAQPVSLDSVYDEYDEGQPYGMTLNGNITASTLTLNVQVTPASYGVSQAGGIITATSLQGTVFSASLTNANLIQQLGPFSAYAGLNLTSTLPLTLTGAVANQIGAVTLTANGISQAPGSSLSTPELDGASTGPTLLNSATNAVQSVGTFTQSAGDFTLVTSSSPLSFGAGLLSATNGSLTLSADTVAMTAGTPAVPIQAPNGTVTFAPFTATRPIELIGTSAANPNALSLNQAFISGISASTLALGNATSTGALNIGNAGETISLRGTAGTLSLATSGVVTQGAGAVLDVAMLTGQTGSVTLGGANTIDTLGAYTVTAPTAAPLTGTFTLDNAKTLTIAGPLSVGGAAAIASTAGLTVSGDVTAGGLILQANGGALTQTAGLISQTSTAEGLSLSASGAVSQTGGSISAVSSLTGTAASLALPSLSNSLPFLGGYTVTGDLLVADAVGLTVQGAIDPGNVTLHTLGNLVIDAPVTGAIGTFTASGTITQGSAGTVTLATLTGSAASLNLTTAANAISTLGSFTTSTGFNLVNGASTAATPLIISGPVTDGVSVTVQNYGPLTVSGNLGAPSVSLTASSTTNTGELGATQPYNTDGTITQTAGSITGTTISLAAGDALTQSGGAITASGTGSTVTLGSNGPLSLAGAISGGSVTITAASRTIPVDDVDQTSLGTITQTAGTVAATGAVSLSSQGPIVLGGSITGGSLGLTAVDQSYTDAMGNPATSFGTVTQNGGVIIAGSISGSADSFALTQPGNQINALTGVTATGTTPTLQLTDSIGLAVIDPLNAGDTSLTITNGTLSIAGPVRVGNLALAVSGAVTATPTGTLLVAGTLTGSAGSLSLTTPVSVARVGDFTSVGGFDLAAAGFLTINGPLSDQVGVTLSGAGPMVFAGVVTAPSIRATTSDGPGPTPGTITQTGGSLNATTLISLIASDRFTQSAGTIDAGTGGVTIVSAGPLSLSGMLTGGAVSLTATSKTSVVSGGGGMLNPGSISGLGRLTATTLSGSASSTVSLGASGNAIGTLGRFSSVGGFALTDGGPLSVTGPVTDTASIALTTGALTLNGVVTAPTVSLVSSGAITQPGGSLQAGTLSGSAAGATLGATGNSVGTLASFASSGDFTLTDAAPLTVSGAVSAGSGHTLTLSDDAPSFGSGSSLSAPGGTVVLAEYTAGRGLTVSGSAPVTAATLVLGSTTGGPVSIGGAFNLSATPTLDLLSSGAISETGAGALQVGTLAGSGASASLGGANLIGTLAGFTTTGAFTLTNGQTLAVSGPLTAGSAALTVAGDLALSGVITAPASLTLNATGAISQPGGSITTASLSGSAASATLARTSNSIAALGPFRTTSVFTLDDGRSLTVTGPVDPLTVTLDVAGALTLNSSVTGDTVNLIATGAITEGSGGSLAAGTLTVAAGSAQLTGSNTVGTLASATTTSGFALVDSGALSVSGPVVDGASIALQSVGALTLAGSLNAPAVSLISTTGRGGSGISQAGGTLTAGTLTGSSAGTLSLGASGNAIGTLGRFSSVGGFALTDGGPLSVTGPVTDTASIALTTGALTLNGVVTAPTVSLVSSGAITQPGGSLQAGTLSGSAAGATLGATGNSVGTLASFASSGDFTLRDAAALTVSGAVSAGSGRTLTLSDDSPSFGSGSSLSAPGGTVVLAEYTAGRGITVSGSAAVPVTAATLVLGSTTGGPVGIAGAFNLSATPTLDLLSSGAISETGAGALQVGTLEGSGASASLGGANLIGTLAGFTTTGAFTLTNGQALTIAGSVSAGSLSLTGPSATIAGSLTTNSLTISLDGSLVQTGGSANIGSLSGTAGQTVSLGQAGSATIGQLTGLVAGSAITVVDRGGLTINGALSAPNIAISATGSLTLNGGSIMTTGLPVVQQVGLTPALPGSFLQVLPGANGLGQFAQTGVTTVTSLNGSAATLRIDLPAAGGSLTLTALNGPTTNLILNPGAGIGVGAINVASLFAVDTGGRVDLTGTVRGQGGFDAAEISQIDPAVDQRYQLNGCAIASQNCLPVNSFLVPQSFLRPDILTLSVLDLSVTRDRDDPTLQLPNISDRDY